MTFEIQLEVKNGEVVRMGLERLEDEYLRVGRKRLYDTVKRMIARITEPPAAFEGDATWLTPKQRSFLFYNVRNGIIRIPYVRTGQYKRGWRPWRNADGYSLIYAGPPEKGDVVSGGPFGDQQSMFHQGRWANAAEIVNEEVAHLPEAIQQDIAITSRRFGY